jgi:rod shape-determining protein MreC
MLDIRQRTGYLFLAVMVGHLILISAQVQSKTGIPVLQSVTLGVFSRVQVAVSSVVDGVRGGWGNYVDLRGVRGQNETLRQQLAELEVRLQEQRALAARAGKLQELMDLKQGSSLPTIAAEVIAGSPIPDMLTITIDRGSADGVQPDMAVISPKGLVGRVLAPVASRAARVQLIIDRDAAVGALTERSRSGGVVLGVQGQSGSPLRMDLVSNHADVQAGDVVVASGVDGIYPKGFVIGTVQRSERGDGLHRDITVQPAVGFSSIEEVLVVLVPAKGATPENATAAPRQGEAREAKR